MARRASLTRTAAGALAAAALGSGLCVAAEAPPSPLLASLFQDHAVLQRDRPIAVWGSATAGETVSVSIGGLEASARADGSGRWSAELPAMGAGGPFTLVARASSGAAQTLSDILVGDVWLCSGQSNMEMTVSGSRNGERAAARSADDRLRLLTVPHVDRRAPAADLPAGALWRVAAPETVRTFSAACYFAGRELQDTVKVPMGLVVAAWGGSAAEAWTAEGGLRAAHGFDDRLDLLRLSLRDETAAHQRMGRMWEDWWRTHARAGTEPWQPEPARTGEWADLPEPMRNWKTWGVPLLARHDGMVWFRRTVTLTPAQASRAATLSLGAIDEVDQTWVNGRPIRNTFGWGTDRTYALPEGVLRAGENVIVVNVLSTWDAGGMTGPAEKLALSFDDGTKVALGGGWRYQVVPLEIGRPPRAPWESVAGLTTLYNGMIAPLGRFGLRGVVWYQGETNADAPAGYQAILAGLMSSWRAQFGAELPFVVVQLPGFGPTPVAPVESGWSEVREAQRRAVDLDPHAALAVTIDLGERDDIHPINKREVGVRIARALRRVAYGEAVAPTGPAVGSANLEPDRVVVSFKDVEGRLVTLQLEPGHGIRAVRRGDGDLPFRERHGRGRSRRDSDERRHAARAAAVLLGRQPGVQPLGRIRPAGGTLRGCAPLTSPPARSLQREDDDRLRGQLHLQRVALDGGSVEGRGLNRVRCLERVVGVHGRRGQHAPCDRLRRHAGELHVQRHRLCRAGVGEREVDGRAVGGARGRRAHHRDLVLPEGVLGRLQLDGEDGTALVDLEHLEHPVGRRPQHLLLVRQDHGLEDVHGLGDVRHHDAVRVPLEDVEVERRDERVSQRVLRPSCRRRAGACCGRGS